MPRGNSHLNGAARAASVARYQAQGRRSWEVRLEKEEAVTRNLSAEQLVLWKRVGSSIKGTPEQRLATFERYVHEHASEVIESLQDAADARLAELIAQREESDLAASEVPF